MLEIELTPTNTPRVIKLQYSAVLKSFLENLKRRENRRNTNEATKGATIMPAMLKEKINITGGCTIKKFICLS